jgi:hypothetical protein
LRIEERSRHDEKQSGECHECKTARC